MTYLDKVISQHIPDPPALIRVRRRQLRVQLGLDLLRRKLFSDSDEIRDRQQSD
jgi:hypothetical protein